MAMAFVRTLVRSTFPPPYTRGLRVILGAEEKLMAKLLEEKDEEAEIGKHREEGKAD